MNSRVQGLPNKDFNYYLIGNLNDDTNSFTYLYGLLMFDLTKIVSLSFLFAPSLKMLFHFQSSGQDMGLIVGLQLLIQQLKGGNVNLDGPLTLEQILHN